MESTSAPSLATSGGSAPAASTATTTQYRGRGRGNAFGASRGRGRGGRGGITTPTAEPGTSERGRGRGRGAVSTTRGGRRGGGNHNRHGRPKIHHQGPPIKKELAERPPLPDASTATVDDITQDHRPTDQRFVNAMKDQKKTKKDVKVHSEFYELTKTLSTAASVAEYILANQQSSLRKPKPLHLLLQTISGRQESFYEELFTQYKVAVVTLLQRLVDQCSGQSPVVLPAAHEWAIRCDRAGMKKSLWAESLAEENASLLLLSPKEMLARIPEVDPVGYTVRLIEMCTKPQHFVKAAKHAASEAFLTSCTKSSDGYVVLARLVSKARRYLGGCEKATEEEPSPATEEEQRAIVSAVFDACRTITEVLKGKAGSLTSTVSAPLAKLKHFADWARTHKLLDSSLDEWTSSISAESDTGLEQQAVQMEAVLHLKEVNTDETLKGVLETILEVPPTESEIESSSSSEQQVWSTPLLLRSPDVLSALAVAASKSVISEAWKRRVMYILMATQAALQSSNSNSGTSAGGSFRALPRRALAFVSSEQNRIRQEQRATVLKRARDEEDGEDDKQDERDEEESLMEQEE